MPAPIGSAPLTPEQLAEIPVKLEKLTRDFESVLLEDISRRIAKAGTITDSAEWQIIQLKEMGYANDFIEKALVEYTGLAEKEIKQLFFDAGQCSDDFYSKVYNAAGKSFTPLEENLYMQQLISAGIEQTKNELRNFTRSMGFSVKQADGSTAFKSVAEAYQNALDLAQMQVSMGVFDYNTAIRNAVKTLADGGLRYVDYATGHVNHADVAVRRAVLTGVSQMTGKVAMHNMDELETDIVEVSAHAGARPDHAVWQGKRYSFSGKTKNYPSLAAATRYGHGDGLKGWNCRHDFYPFIPGISIPSYTEEELKNIDPPPIEYDGKTYTYYECTQRQRRIETAIRKTKREIIAAEASGDDEMLLTKSGLLRRQQEEYVKFSKAAELLTQNERTQVYGFGRSEAAKASQAARKTLDKSDKSGIIKAGSGVVPKNNVVSAQSVLNRKKTAQIIENGISLEKPIFADGLLGENAKNIKPEKDFYDIVMHGTSVCVEFFGTDIDSGTLAKIIKGRKDYDGKPIRLLSCSTGNIDDTANCFAQRLANELGVVVKAPNLTLYVDKNGNMTVGRLNEGEFRLFYPRK